MGNTVEWKDCRKDYAYALHQRHCSGDLWAKDCKIIQRSSKGMEPVELRSPFGRRQQDHSFVQENSYGREGHTLHATYEEAEERTIRCWEVYKDCYKETMAIPFVAGRKGRTRKFAGAEDTYTIEALMHDGKSTSVCDKPFLRKRIPGCIRNQICR